MGRITPTALAPHGDGITAGTFVGGLAIGTGGNWKATPQLAGENVTALTPADDGSLWVATRNAVWRRHRGGALEPLDAPLLATEAQALCSVPGGLWVGTRTGLFFVRRPGLTPGGVARPGDPAPRR